MRRSGRDTLGAARDLRARGACTRAYVIIGLAFCFVLPQLLDLAPSSLVLPPELSSELFHLPLGCLHPQPQLSRLAIGRLGIGMDAAITWRQNCITNKGSDCGHRFGRNCLPKQK